MEKNKMFIFIIIGILFTTVIAVSVALFFTLNSLKSITGLNQENTKVQEGKVNPEGISIFSISDPITANLIAGTDKDDKHILRISVGLGLDSSQKDFKELNEQLTEKIAILRDNIIRVIRNKTYEEMREPNAQELMGDEILSNLKEEFQTDTIKQIYFGEFFVQ